MHLLRRLKRPQTNYEAIQAMSPKQLAAFLDEVWCIGCNDGSVLERLPADQKEQFEESIIFDRDWMNAPADYALLTQCSRFKRTCMMDASVRAISRNVGVDLYAVTEKEASK